MPINKATKAKSEQTNSVFWIDMKWECYFEIFANNKLIVCVQANEREFKWSIGEFLASELNIGPRHTLFK